MCTAIHFLNQQNENVFGRTMDFHFLLEPHFSVFPRGYHWTDSLGQKCTDLYGVAGIGQYAQSRCTLFDGVNEEGLAGAALYFKGYADFPVSSKSSVQRQLPALDFLHLALGSCRSLDDLGPFLKNSLLVGIHDGLTDSIAPLHWIFTDLSGKGVVVEQTHSGLHIYDNPVGVLTNSPDFSWQITNLRNYTAVTSEQGEKINWGSFPMEPFGQAAGTSALPGGYTPPARFVRTVFQKLHMVQPDGGTESIHEGFHLLEGVTLPKGAVKTANGSFDYTQYTALIDLKRREYYFKTYDNPQVIRVDINPIWAAPEQSIQDLGSIRVPVRYGTLN